MFACGIPAGLISPDVGGAAARDSLRVWLASSVAPMLRSLGRELNDQLAEPMSFDFADLKLADLISRARSFASLVNADADFASAAAEVGLGPDLKPAAAAPSDEGTGE